MKNYLYLLLLIILIFSCKKDKELATIFYVLKSEQTNLLNEKVNTINTRFSVTNILSINALNKSISN